MPRSVFVVSLLLILLVLGVVLLWRSIRTERRLRRSSPIIPHSSQVIEKETSNTVSSSLPALRPKIYPARYGKRQADNRSGLFIRNDGETAFSILVHPVKIGSSLMDFWTGIPVLAKDTGEVLVENHIQKATGVGTFGTALMAEMVQFGLLSIPLKITYKDGDNRWYETECELERDVLTPGGIAVKFIAQNFTTEPQTQKNDKAEIPISSSAPRPYLEVLDVADSMFGKTPFEFTNRGGDVAHNVQVQPVSIHHRTVVFDLIPMIAVNEQKETVPTILGADSMRSHDFLELMMDAWNSEFNAGRLAAASNAHEWPVKITVTYEDFAQNKFEATSELVIFPIQKAIADQGGIWPSKQNLKTVEVRNLKFKLVGGQS